MHKIALYFMFTHKNMLWNVHQFTYIIYCPIQHDHLKNNFNTKSDKNIHYSALNYTFSSKILSGGA